MSSRDAYLRRWYGVSEEEFNAIVAHQGGGCAGCGAAGITRSLHLDHSHRTKLVRGVLCPLDNRLLALGRDDPETLEKLAAYLRNPPAELILGQRYVPRERKRRRKKRKPGQGGRDRS